MGWTGRTRAVITAVLLIVAGGAAACGSGDGDDAASEGEPVEIDHVHGLGIEPAGGALLVATHHGLFRLDGAAPDRVSNETHDFMGFTVDGDDRYVASGHPTLGSREFADLPRPLLGLVESTDGGRSWTVVSLAGEVDFHSLEAAHGRLFGFDSTQSRLMVSEDAGATWDVRSQVPLHDIAVDPASHDHLVASTPGGVVESGDGGRSWSPQADAPALVFVDWHDERGLWGLDSEGRVHSFDAGSGDGRGGGWQARALLGGAPQALLAHDSGLFAATHGAATALHRSDDGDSWKVLYRAGRR